MAWAPDYCTAAELKSWMRITVNTEDTLLGFTVTAASRAVDGYCNRQFGSVTPAVTRYYQWDGTCDGWRAVLLIDDLQTVTDLVVATDDDDDGTADTTLTLGTDFDLWPLNAAADGVPWTGIMLRPSAPVTFPKVPRAVHVTAKFGWTAVPDAVVQATLMQGARFFSRRNAPFGVAGSPELGSEVRLLEKLDPDLGAGLGHLVRPWGAA